MTVRDFLHALRSSWSSSSWPPARADAPWVHDYRREVDGRVRRHHLRIDPDGSAVVTIDASIVVQLNRTAAQIAQELLDGIDRDEVVRTLYARYPRAGWDSVREDVAKVAAALDPSDRDRSAAGPIRLLSIGAATAAHSRTPWRIDLELRRADDSPIALALGRRVLARARDIGVPHVRLVDAGGAAADVLSLLVEHAGDLGLVTSLAIDARALGPAALQKRLLDAGIDHVECPFESPDADWHDSVHGAGSFGPDCEALSALAKLDLSVATVTTLCSKNVDAIEEIVERLVGLGIRQMGASGVVCDAPKDPGIALSSEAFEAGLSRIRSAAGERAVRYFALTPMVWREKSPELPPRGYLRCAAGERTLLVDADGKVGVCRSDARRFGDFVRDPWDTLWRHPEVASFRAAHHVGSVCAACPERRS